MIIPNADWANRIYKLAVQAGEKILQYYTKETLVPEYKTDNSPVTPADKAAHVIINQALMQYAPVLSEEGEQPSFAVRKGWPQYWCVDPLDGTRNFLAKDDEFTVNIALISGHQPVLGVIYAPALQLGYLAWRGGGAYRVDANGMQRPILAQQIIKPLRLLVSRFHGHSKLQPWLECFGEVNMQPQGSALKFCTVAEGKADLFLRLSPAGEWDNAAGQCILEEAGGAIVTLDGQPFSYNHLDIIQKQFIAVGDKSHNWQRYFPKP